MTEEHLGRLLETVRGVPRLLILPHNDPDPDAIASVLALRYLLAATLGIECDVAYKGMIGRAENRALVEYLGNPLRPLVAEDLQPPPAIALLDTQPGAGNNALPPGTAATVVVDHHPLQAATAASAFADVRPDLGATCTILVGYLQAAGLEIDPPLATALFYGIQVDTEGLIRQAGVEDMAAYCYLQPRIEVNALTEIVDAQLPSEYFRRLDATLHAARVYGDVVLSYIGPMIYPDLAAAMADLLLRLEGIQWTIAMGTHDGDLILAVRTRSRQGGAGALVQAIVGDQGTAGGHSTMAGGHVPLQGRDAERLARRLGQAALRHLHVPDGAAGKRVL